ncbi:MAG: 6-phospho-beta-glucosidase, partial [bacterium]
MKIAIIGAGSTYTPELIEGFIEYREKMPFQEISLIDRDPSRLNIIGDFAKRMLRRAGMEKLLHITTDMEEALSDAAFVLTQIRVGGSRGRLLDEEIAREFGLVAQETTGVGGFSHALRAIPQMLEIARVVECFCPQAWVINFTNPSGIITEALANYSSVKVIGLCNVPLVMRRDIAASLGVQAESLKVDSFGLNHLSWVQRILLGETDLTAAALEEIEKVEILKKMDSRLIRKLNLIPSPYLRYYYQTESVLKEQETETLRAQKVIEIEQSLLRLYAEPGLDKKPPMLSERGGALYSVAALGLMASLLGTEPVVHTVNVQNRGAIVDI